MDKYYDSFLKYQKYIKLNIQNRRTTTTSQPWKCKSIDNLSRGK